MIKLTLEAENPKELHEALSNLQDGYNDEVLDNIMLALNRPPEIMTNAVSANEMFNQMFQWFKENKEKLND